MLPPASNRLPPPRMGRILAVLLACLLGLSTHPSLAQSVRIGYVDMQRLLVNAPQIIAARGKMQKEFDARDAELRVDEARLAELELRAGSAAAPEDRDGLKRQADALRRSIERTRERLRDELNARVDEETERAWPLINDAIAEHGRAQGYDLIVTSPVAYVSGRIDVTDDVLALLRRQQQDGTR